MKEQDKTSSSCCKVCKYCSIFILVLVITLGAVYYFTNPNLPIFNSTQLEVSTHCNVNCDQCNPRNDGKRFCLTCVHESLSINGD